MLEGSARRAGVDAAPHLRVLSEHPIDLEVAARAVSDLLVALGQDPSSEHLAGTPRRVAAALAESLPRRRSR